MAKNNENNNEEDKTPEIEKFVKTYLIHILLFFVFSASLLSLSESLAEISNRGTTSPFTQREYELTFVPNVKADTYFPLHINNLFFDVNEEKNTMNVTLYMQRTDWIKEINFKFSDPNEQMTGIRLINAVGESIDFDYKGNCDTSKPQQVNCSLDKIKLGPLANITMDIKTNVVPHGEFTVLVKGQNISIGRINKLDFTIKTKDFRCVSTYCFPQKEGTDFSYILVENKTLYHISRKNVSNSDPALNFVLNSENQKLIENKNKDLANVLTLAGIVGGGLIAIFIEFLKFLRRK